MPECVGRTKTQSHRVRSGLLMNFKKRNSRGKWWTQKEMNHTKLSRAPVSARICKYPSFPMRAARPIGVRLWIKKKRIPVEFAKEEFVWLSVSLQDLIKSRIFLQLSFFWMSTVHSAPAAFSRSTHSFTGEQLQMTARCSSYSFASFLLQSCRVVRVNSRVL